MRTLYVQGDTALHRLSPRVKLIALLVISLLIFITYRPFLLLTAMVVAAGLYASLRLGWQRSWLYLRVILLSVALVSLFTMAFNGMAEAIVVALRLLALALFAATITATTSTAEFIDAVTAAALPIERLGLMKAADLGLAIGLVIRFVPEVLARYEAVRDAHRARGLKQRPLTLAVPLIIQTLRHADEIAAAIDARAIRRQK
jgi:biotin transport system permease protein